MRTSLVAILIGLTLAGGLRAATWPEGRSRTVDKDTFWRLKTHPRERFDGVLVGDSRTYRGLSPTVMEGVLVGRRIHNLGYPSGRLSEDLLDHAQALLDPQSTSPFIVVGIAAHALSRAKEGPQNPEFARHQGLGDFEQRLAHWSRPLRQHWFRPLIADPTVELQMARQGASKIRYHQRFDERGFAASYTEPANPRRALKSYRKTLRKHPVDPGVVKALAQRVRQWRHDGIRVYGLRLPLHASLDKLERSRGRYRPATIRRTLEDAGMTWLTPKTDDLATYDGSHLNEPSALRLSERLARLVRADLGS